MKIASSVVAAMAILSLSGVPTPMQAASIMVPPSSLPPPTVAGYAPIHGVKIYYAEWGRGAPVILAENALGSTIAWGYLVPVLAKHYRVIAFDTRCQGHSTCSPQSPTYQLMASDLDALMQYLHLRHAAFVGWSQGANLGLEMAIRYPGRLTRIFAYGAHSSPATFRMPSHYSATDIIAAHWIQLQNPDWRTMLKRFSKLSLTEPNLTAVDLQSIRVKTWVVDGDRDEYIQRSDTDFMASRIPASGELILPNTGHYAVWQDPSMFDACVLSFLGSP